MARWYILTATEADELGDADEYRDFEGFADTDKVRECAEYALDTCCRCCKLHEALVYHFAYTSRDLGIGADDEEYKRLTLDFAAGISEFVPCLGKKMALLSHEAE